MVHDMMRTPLTTNQMYGWWQKALAGERPPLHDADPQAGWYRRRLVKNGGFVGVKIYWVQDVDEAGELLGTPTLHCTVNGRETDPYAEWSWIAGSAITPEEYDRLMGANIMDAPTKAVDWMKEAPPF